LAANRQVVEHLVGWRWGAMCEARQQGHGWAEIGAALGVDAAQARQLYLEQVKRQRLVHEAHPDLRDLLGYDPRWPSWPNRTTPTVPTSSERPAVNAERLDRRAISGGGVRPDGQPGRPPSAPARPPAGRVSTLDRITLQLGVAAAMVIALCSYAVSGTSLYALGVRAGYSWWQAAAVPVVADGPAIYGMFRIVSRSRRGAPGAGYGWLLVGCGTAASIGGNVAHAQPNLVAQAIAAAIPLAVLAMLEGLKGDAGEVTRQTRRTLASGRQVGLAHSGRPAQPTSPDRTHASPTLPQRAVGERDQGRR
jgi:hypothetical protein